MRRRTAGERTDSEEGRGERQGIGAVHIKLMSKESRQLLESALPRGLCAPGPAHFKLFARFLLLCALARFACVCLQARPGPPLSLARRHWPATRPRPAWPHLLLHDYCCCCCALSSSSSPFNYCSARIRNKESPFSGKTLGPLGQGLFLFLFSFR